MSIHSTNEITLSVSHTMGKLNSHLRQITMLQIDSCTDGR